MESKKLLQTAVLLALVLFTILYVHLNFLVGPLRSERDQLQAKIAAAQAQVDSSSFELRKIALEEQAESQNIAVNDLFNRMVTSAPRVPLVDCPILLKKVLLRHNVAGSKFSPNGYFPFRGLPEASVQSWGISIPEIKPTVFGETLADLENVLPLAQVSEFTLAKTQADGPVHAVISLQFVILP